MRRDGSANLFWVAIALAAAVAAVALVTVGLLVKRYTDEADYPGAERVAGDNAVKLGLFPTIRRDTSYRTQDPLPAVYNWYSYGFKLGPEDYAQGACIQMSRSFVDFFVIERDMSVTVCDTSQGRLIFVMRELTFRPR